MTESRNMKNAKRILRLDRRLSVLSCFVETALSSAAHLATWDQPSEHRFRCPLRALCRDVDWRLAWKTPFQSELNLTRQTPLNLRGTTTIKTYIAKSAIKLYHYKIKLLFLFPLSLNNLANAIISIMV